MKKSYILLSIMISALFACDKLDSIANGSEETSTKKVENELIQKTYHSNGNLMTLVELDSSKKFHGEAKKFYENGILKSVTLYDHGTITDAKQYFENGQLSMHFQYKDGVKHGRRLKYWENGQLQSELSYFNGEPQKGLVEYKKSGEKITKYPRLIVQQHDKLASNGTYQLEAYFSSNPQRGTYYKTQLVNGTVPRFADKFDRSGKHGIYTYRPAPGQFIMEKAHVVGKFMTAYNNVLIVEKTVNVAIDY